MYLPELYAPPEQVDETKTDIPELRKFIEAQSVHFNYRQTATLVKKLNATITQDANKV